MKVLGEAISGVRGRVLLLPPDLTRLHSGGGRSRISATTCWKTGVRWT